MKKVLLVSLVLAGCGDAPTRFVPVEGTPGQDGESCYAEQATDGVFIYCPDSEVVFIQNGAQGEQGPVGPQGEQGPAGQDGKSCTKKKGKIICE